MDADRGELSPLIAGDVVVSDFDVAADRLVYLASSLERPPAIWTANLTDLVPTRLFDPNPWLEERALGQVTPIGFELDGHPVGGWGVRPRDAGERTPPAVLHVHGGPHSAYGQVFTLLFHLLAGAGFTVVFCNPPGSATYDEAYVLSLHDSWGKVDSRCLLAFADHVVKSGVVDGQRLGIAGTSYGGFPVLRTLARDARFKAALMMRAITNGTSIEADVGAATAPAVQIERIETPLLMLVSGDDQRVPPEQSQRVYDALRRLGRDVELVVFPGEGHSIAVIGRPGSRVAHARAILGWWTRHLCA